MTDRLHLPCPSCTSSDAFTLYEDGHGHCFSCNTNFREKQLMELGYEEKDTAGTRSGHNISDRIKSTDVANVQLPRGTIQAITDRRLSEETCRKYNVSVNEKGDHLYPYYSQSKEQHAVKFRTVDKQFPATPRGKIQSSLLFGQQAFGEGGRYITITEGELDAMSAYQMHGSMYPCVSVQSSSTAVRDCKNNWEWLNSYEKVYLAFDMDKPGQIAAKKVANLFPGKAYMMHMGQYKDANDYLVAGKAKTWKDEWWRSGEVKITGFLAGEALLTEMGKPIPRGVSLPWPTLDAAMYGVRMHELITLGSGSGLGKTETYKEIIYHLTTVEDSKCGVLFLEETPAKTGLCVYGKAANLRLQRPEYAETRVQTIKDLAEFDQISRNLVIVDHKGESDLDRILAKIEYMVTALSCKYIFLDHITAICEGKDEGNVNHQMHVAMEALNRLLQRHEFSLFMISHLNQPSGTPHEEGGRVTMRNFYGSGAIKQRSNFVWGLEGNQQLEGEAKHHRQLRVLKDRELGEATGVVMDMKYDLDTGRFEEYNIDEFTERLEGEEG